LEGPDSDLTLLDTGAAGSAGVILRGLPRLGLSPEHLKMIVLSHHHPDHTGGLALLAAHLGAEVAAHPLDIPNISGVSPGLGRWGDLRRRVGMLGFARRVPVSRALEDGDRLPFAPWFRVLHTPGHTAGSITLYDDERRLAIIGDAMNHRWGVLSGPSWLFTADRAAAWRSIARLAELDPATIAFAHFPPITERAGERLRALVSGRGGAAREPARLPAPRRWWGV
ncbi:MAG: MBL fold metallo-hydrolase, partial [Chloroflexi bacterium]|nr:MBL fold metallo-hydrolase [Chloroflexota bacterium]